MPTSPLSKLLTARRWRSVKIAINNFVLWLQAGRHLDAIKASCILAGARTR
jgi:hypothetical protein